MICKKCGREYDDDMPKCLWCDAPNDSKVDSSATNPADGTEPEETATLSEYEIYCKNAVFWLSFFFIGLTILAIPTEISIATHGGFDNYFGELLKGFLLSGILGIFVPFIFLQFLSGTRANAVGDLLGFGIIINFFLLFVHLFVTSWIAIYKFCAWLHCVLKEHHRYSETDVTPRGAIFCALIPIIFPVYHYMIFKDLLARQKEALGQNSLENAHLPGWMLKAIPFLGFTIQIGWFLGLFVAKGLFAARVLSIILSIILLVCYIKVIKAITANTIALNSLATNDGPTDIPDTAASYEPSKATPSDELDRGSPDNPQRPA